MTIYDLWKMYEVYKLDLEFEELYSKATKLNKEFNETVDQMEKINDKLEALRKE